ncbi:hydroxymethylglutaryl-CoA reductase, degradative [Labilibacter marinus]|uniref:hydroxymethylglutaryl-CoA reductase, degradative n=1 Tax=Labilibacter marinus TaxID=1477105 RepID=UPI001E4847DD|nr:hydroxymethylglutaryl-CoA reductase, degradative [Labilibacter marinus]
MIKGFSKLSQKEKIDVLLEEFKLPQSFKDTLEHHQHSELQEIYNQFSENTLSNFYMPYGVAPGFVINGKEYAIPMTIEESSVVAAASKAAKFWSNRGGFQTKVISTLKVGQLFFTTDFGYIKLLEELTDIKEHLLSSITEISHSMEQRGGGIHTMKLNQEPLVDKETYCLMVSFETVDSMGANFINSCLEKMGEALCNYLKSKGAEAEVNMAILSNYTPDCIVECTLSCAIEDLKAYSGDYTPDEFAQRFKKAVLLAQHNSSRAVTHNKGIMNGIDAVVLATGNDFRAIEAGVHAYAAQSGQYSSLTKVKLTENEFKYTLTIPLALGTVGGLTKLHPLAGLSLRLLGNPSATELMQIIAAAGMANNFSAIAALVTSGIQKGHMKMHLSNILSTFNATSEEIGMAIDHFGTHVISHSAVKSYLELLRNNE